MSIYRKIIAVFISIAITFSLITISASASVGGNLEAFTRKNVILPFTDFVVDILSAGDTIYDTLSSIQRENFRDTVDFWSRFFGSDSTESYDDYVSTLDTPVVDNIGIGLPYAYEFVPSSTYVEEISSSISSFESFYFKDQSNVSLGTYYWDFAVSKDGTYTFHFPTASCTCGSSSGHCGSYMYANIHFISYSVDGGATWKNLASYSSGAVSLTHTLGLYSGYLYRLSAGYARDVSSLGYHAVTLSSAPYLTGGSVIQDTPSSRPSTLMQSINNYNNSVTNNTTNNTDNSTKYYIGTVDAGGDVTNVYNVNLYDEQTMVFTEPVTGAQYQTTGWTYDYTTRCYTLSLASGTFTYGDTDIDEIQISYGDEYMLLRYYSDGDLVLSDPYYYVISIETGCEHAYTSETVTAPTCTEQGVRRYTCELCGYTRDEKIPATGHTWEATETVETELNENGDVTKLGYTVYTCSTCGETYKQYDGTGQPGPPGGSGTGDGEESSGWLSKLLDTLKDIFSPDIDIELDVSGGEATETQKSWFTKLILKFTWLTSVHDIYQQLAADVVSDASTAAAVSDGTVLLADVTTGHAAVANDDSTQAVAYTAPELAISFGASDKYGVDWEDIKAIDLSWYAPYKKTVDGILSGILWLSYLFLLIKRAPGIIRGSEMVTEDSIKIDLWRSKHGS